MLTENPIYTHLAGHITVPNRAPKCFLCYDICGFCCIPQVVEDFEHCWWFMNILIMTFDRMF